CGEKPAGGRIVGGSNATLNQIPWQVSWRFFNQTTNTHRHICGASIIADKWLLTAAHCVDVVKPLEEKNFRAYVGLLSQSAPDSNSKLMTIKKITMHSGWDSQQIINDVAVVELDEPIGLESSNLNAICLGRPTDNVEGKMSVISGWGLEVHGGSQIPDRLKFATVPVEKQSDCKRIYSFIKPLTDGEVCAGKNPGGCNGD
ncbi:PREDICTED: transmembrane protease serine 9-like, partial [Rhagoletis zephyria]|uniref:transmembrane protease serine 9-like n=1 Tax=Rhagoletis zephyria TaxID=28612 RepID=UPI0008116B71